MLILDTDHLTAIDRATAFGAILRSRLANQEDDFCTTIVSICEQLKGLLALISSARNDHDILERYSRLSKKLRSLQDFGILDWTEAAAREFHDLRRARNSASEPWICASPASPSRMMQFCCRGNFGTSSVCPDCASRTGCRERA